MEITKYVLQHQDGTYLQYIKKMLARGDLTDAQRFVSREEAQELANENGLIDFHIEPIKSTKS